MVFAPWLLPLHHGLGAPSRRSSGRTVVHPKKSDGAFPHQHRHLFRFSKASLSVRVEPWTRAAGGTSAGTCFAWVRSAVAVEAGRVVVPGYLRRNRCKHSKGPLRS